MFVNGLWLILYNRDFEFLFYFIVDIFFWEEFWLNVLIVCIFLEFWKECFVLRNNIDDKLLVDDYDVLCYLGYYGYWLNGEVVINEGLLYSKMFF